MKLFNRNKKQDDEVKDQMLLDEQVNIEDKDEEIEEDIYDEGVVDVTERVNDNDVRKQQYYDDEDIVNFVPIKTRLLNWIKEHVQLSIIIAGIIAVVIVVVTVVLVALNNNPINNLVRATSRAVDSDSLEMKINIKYNDQDYMNADVKSKFNQREVMYYSVGDVKYTNYEYSSVTYSFGKKAYTGVKYKDEWHITDTKQKINDFYDFYKDFKNLKFDGNAYLSFTGKNGSYDPVELSKSIDRILTKLQFEMQGTMKCDKQSESGYTTYTFNPDVDKVLEIVKQNTASAFMNSDMYSDFVESYELNHDNFAKCNVIISYTQDERGRLTNFLYEVDSPEQKTSISIDLSGFGETQLEFPDDFFEAANIAHSGDD